MSDDIVTKHECELMHKVQSEINNEIKTTLNTILKKMDDIIIVKNTSEENEKKVTSLGIKYDKHVDDHWKFIRVCLDILALAAFIVAVAMKFIK